MDFVCFSDASWIFDIGTYGSKIGVAISDTVVRTSTGGPTKSSDQFISGRGIMDRHLHGKVM